MPSRKAWLAGLAIMTFGAASSPAQIPGLPSTPSVPGVGTSAIPGLGGGTTTAGSTATTAAGSTGFCAGLSACVQKCKAKLCASQFGQMLNSGITGPVGSLTGGFIPSICPPMNAAQAAALAAAQPGSAAATAAAIQASEADAKARVAAIEYLGTVDCTRWPEAQKALLNGLRQDTNECVRFAAARALNSGCCCSQKVIDALQVCVSGSDKDGAPAENSFRVKAAAFSALQNCLMRVPAPLEEEPKPPRSEGEQPQQLIPLPPRSEGPTARRAAVDSHIAAAYTPPRPAPVSYEEQLRRKPFSQTVAEARRTLVEVSQTARPPATVPSGQRSLFGALSRARHEVGRAREQGQVPPGPGQSAEPGATMPAPTPAPAPGASASLIASPPTEMGAGAEPGIVAGSPVPAGTAEDATSTSPGENPPGVRSPARRGLIGMLFQPRSN